jgi:protein-disulfide isomerase
MGCGGAAAPDPAPKSQDQSWAQEEILLQLKELREDVSRLQKDAELAKSMDARLTALEAAATRRAGNGGPAGPGREILFGDAVPRGSASAKVAVVEFTDFECPFCARHFHEVFPQLKKAFIDTGRIRYYARNYPLEFHSHARSAAVAAVCAEQVGGKYWQMHDRLFSGGSALGADFYRESATSLGVDAQRFSACMADPLPLQRVNADVQYANTVGVSGTPKFFVGRIQGNKIVDAIEVQGARPFEYFRSVIESRMN